MEMHSGRIAAASDGRDKGHVTLTIREMDTGFRLPTCRRQRSGRVQAAGPVARPRPGQVLMACRILLVEDDPDTRRICYGFQLHWQSFGYSVEAAGCVKEALQLIDRETFDLLLSDIGLPDGSGTDIMIQVKASSRIKGIALSGFGQHDECARGHEAGFEMHPLTKPGWISIRTSKRYPKVGEV